MKELTVKFVLQGNSGADVPPKAADMPVECLYAAARLMERLCRELDFRQRLAEFLKSCDWEVPMESWQLPPDT